MAGKGAKMEKGPFGKDIIGSIFGPNFISSINYRYSKCKDPQQLDKCHQRGRADRTLDLIVSVLLAVRERYLIPFSLAVKKAGK